MIAPVDPRSGYRGPPLLWSRLFGPAMERSNSTARIEVGRATAVPVVGEKDPSCQVKRVPRPRSVEGLRQQGEIRLGEFLSPPEQAHGDKEIGKKRTPEFRSVG